MDKQDNIQNLNINSLTSPEGRASSPDQTKPKVFIPNQSAHDFSDALRYGDLDFISYGEIHCFSVGNMARRWMTKLLKSSDEDLILITSLTILNCVGCAIFGYLHGRLNLLLFKNERYIKRTLDFKQLKEGIEKEMEQ